MAASVLAACVSLCMVSTLAAQQPVRGEQELPPGVADAVFAFFNDPGTVRFVGEVIIPAGARVAANVAVLGGPLLLAGAVDGSVLVINGHARLEPGCRIAGDLTVLGGAITGEVNATVAGRVSAYPQPLRIRREGELLQREPALLAPQLSGGREWGQWRTYFGGHIRGGYNRAEGLPIAVGPRIELNRAFPTQLDALVIYRTESGLRLALDELGYFVRLEQRLLWRFRVQGSRYSEVRPIEAWGLSDLENALRTFVLRRDSRDYYERTGTAAFLSFLPDRGVYDLRVGYRHETHDRVATQGPWTLTGNDQEWRAQPAIAEGGLRSLDVRIGYDTRNVHRDPSAGLLLEGRFEQGLGGGLRLVDGRPANDRFRAGFLDLRRYARLGPGSRLSLRVVTAGSLDGEALPPQRQHALGGVGSLPAYSQFRFDCSARAEPPGVELDGKQYFENYGCDRMALIQLEYSALFPFVGNLVRELGWGAYLGQTPAWVGYFDVGRAWTEDEAAAASGRGTGQNDFAADAGFGLRFGQIGLYWTVPLSSSGRGITFFMRASSRL